jgi:hypothetical protein
MGKKERVRKQQRLEQKLAEQAAAERRRKDKVEPIYQLTKRFVVVTAATILILYLGVVVTAKLPEILQRISRSVN